MGNYYYLVPTLPALKSDMNEYMSLDDFLKLCKGYLSKKDYEILSHATLNGSDEVKGNHFIKEFSLVLWDLFNLYHSLKEEKVTGVNLDFLL